MLGMLLLITSALIVWNWGIAATASSTIWAIVDVLFIIIPIFYLVNCSCAGEKNSDRRKINPFILSGLILIAAGAIYQLSTGKFGVMDDMVWNYIDGFSVILYSCLAGRLLR